MKNGDFRSTDVGRDRGHTALLTLAEDLGVCSLFAFLFYN